MFLPCVLFVLSLCLVACHNVNSSSSPSSTLTNDPALIDSPLSLGDDQDNNELLIIDKKSNERDEKFPVKAYKGQLGEQLEFDLNSVTQITLFSPNQLGNKESDIEPKEIVLDENFTQYIKQNLFWLYLESYKVDLPPQFISHPIIITLFANNEQYELTYELMINAYKLGDEYYYADHEVAELMSLYFNPDSKLAKVALLKQLHSAAHNVDGGLQFYEHRYEFEQLSLNHLDYHEWYELIAEHPDTEQIGLEYNIAINDYSPLLYNPKLDILFSDALYFFSDQLETIDGIKIGIKKDEVLKKLGKPNYGVNTKWSYYIGDYLKFHLYFDENQVIVMLLTLPV